MLYLDGFAVGANEKMKIERLSKMRHQLNEVSRSFCLAKWYQVTLYLFNGNTQSCPHVSSHHVPLSHVRKDPQTLHNSRPKVATRQKMLKGQFPKECEYCWRLERTQQYSDRIYKSAESWANNKISEAQSHLSVNPTYLEVAFDNICNFKCMYCSPVSSSLWDNEIKKYGPYPTRYRYHNRLLTRLNKTMALPETIQEEYIQSFWKWWPTLSKDLKHLRITGGEPLLSKDMWRVLEELQRTPQKELEFAINSNMGVPHQLVQRMVTQVNQLEGSVKNFTLYCSIDTVGKQAEYIRFGLDFELFKKNVEFFMENIKWPISLSLMNTVNSLSLVGLKDFMTYALELRKKYPEHHLGIDTPYLRRPEHMSPFILTDDYKKYLTQAIHFMKTHLGKNPGFYPEEVQRLERILEVFHKKPFKKIKLAFLRRDFYKMFKEYDKRRQTNFHETFPEYRSFWQLCRHHGIL